jgi:hypothetical protein
LPKFLFPSREQSTSFASAFWHGARTTRCDDSSPHTRTTALMRTSGFARRQIVSREQAHCIGVDSCRRDFVALCCRLVVVIVSASLRRSLAGIGGSTFRALPLHRQRIRSLGTSWHSACAAGVVSARATRSTPFFTVKSTPAASAAVGNNLVFLTYNAMSFAPVDNDFSLLT